MTTKLTKIERDIVKGVNFKHGTKFKGAQLLEWNSSEDVVKNNLQEGEVVYEWSGFYAAFKQAD